MAESSELIEFWKRWDVIHGPPFAHPDDWPVLRRKGGRYIDEDPKDFAEFVSSPRFGDSGDTRFHLSLLPTPYSGDLRAADIILLVLNPGFALSDYYAESRSPKFCDRLKGTLAQDFVGVDFPFVWLDPEYCWHGGFRYWERKLHDVTELIAKEKFGGRYLDALRHLSKRLAHVELVPYHSSSFKAYDLIKDLPSARAARRFAQESASQGDKTIIVTRRAASWEISTRNDNLIVYEGGLTRGASLGPDSPGGRAILDKYGIQSGPSAAPRSIGGSTRGARTDAHVALAPVNVPTGKAGTRFADYVISLVKPDAASPTWRGKRGEAFRLIEDHYHREPATPLTVAMWLDLVAATGLTNVGFDFVRFYQGLNPTHGGHTAYITLTAHTERRESSCPHVSGASRFPGADLIQSPVHWMTEIPPSALRCA
jgi:hypothetical protein